MSPLSQGAKATGQAWRDNYGTPGYILRVVNRFWPMGWFDPCPVNPDFDGLIVPWGLRCFINPPFSEYERWAAHGLQQEGEQIWLSHTSNGVGWFKELLGASSAIILMKKKIKFIDPLTGEPTKNTPFDKHQCLTYIGSEPERFAGMFRELGQPMRKM